MDWAAVVSSRPSRKPPSWPPSYPSQSVRMPTFPPAELPRSPTVAMDDDPLPEMLVLPDPVPDPPPDPAPASSMYKVAEAGDPTVYPPGAEDMDPDMDMDVEPDPDPLPDGWSWTITVSAG